MAQVTKFTAECYGQSMATEANKSWCVALLPPTTETFTKNTGRAHLQTFLWKDALQLYPHRLEPTDYGWMKQWRQYHQALP